MPLNLNIVKQRMADFIEACEHRGVKITHQRIEIYRVLAETDEHPDVETIHHRVCEKIPRVSLDTVYRNLKLLAEHGLVTAVGLTQERLRFDANISPHHHFVCLQCGAIHDFTSDKLHNLGVPGEAVQHGQPISMRVEIKGICNACQTRSTPSSQPVGSNK